MRQPTAKVIADLEAVEMVSTASCMARPVFWVVLGPAEPENYYYTKSFVRRFHSDLDPPRLFMAEQQTQQPLQ